MKRIALLILALCVVAAVAAEQVKVRPVPAELPAVKRRGEVFQRLVGVEDEDARCEDRARLLDAQHSLTEGHPLAFGAAGRDRPEGGRTVLQPDELRGFGRRLRQ